MDSGIKQLLECERIAKQRLDLEEEKNETIKEKALADANKYIETYISKKNNILRIEEEKIEKYLNDLEETLKEENKKRVDDIHNRNLEEIINEIVFHVIGSMQNY